MQPSPVVLCMQNSDFRTRITSLCRSKTPPVVFACKTSTSGPEQQMSMGARHDLSFCACTTACLESEILVSIGSRPHLCCFFCIQLSDFRTRIACLYGSQPSSVVLCNQKTDLRTRIACLYGSQTSPVILCMQYSVISIRITCLYGSQHLSVVFACRTATFWPE